MARVGERRLTRTLNFARVAARVGPGWRQPLPEDSGRRESSEFGAALDKRDNNDTLILGARMKQAILLTKAPER